MWLKSGESVFFSLRCHPLTPFPLSYCVQPLSLAAHADFTVACICLPTVAKVHTNIPNSINLAFKGLVRLTDLRLDYDSVAYSDVTSKIKKISSQNTPRWYTRWKSIWHELSKQERQLFDKADIHGKDLLHLRDSKSKLYGCGVDALLCILPISDCMHDASTRRHYGQLAL